jgi:hypothetical protein
LDKEQAMLMENLQKVSVKYCMMSAYDYGLQKTSESTLAAACIYAGSLKLGIDFQHKYDNILAYWIQSLAGEDRENFQQMETAAKNLVDLEENFHEEYPDLHNYKNYEFPYQKKPEEVEKHKQL